MDDPSTKDDEVRTMLCRLFGGDSVEELAEVAVRSMGPETFYIHHTILRFLAKAGNASERAAYLSAAAHWHRVGTKEHPWECIQFYRALLLKEAGRDQWREEIETLFPASECPGMLRLISAVFLTVAHEWSVPWAPKNDVFDALKKEIPNAADRIDLLQVWGASGASWDQLAARVIPFNFH